MTDMNLKMTYEEIMAAVDKETAEAEKKLGLKIGRITDGIPLGRHTYVTGREGVGPGLTAAGDLKIDKDGRVEMATHLGYVPTMTYRDPNQEIMHRRYAGRKVGIGDLLEEYLTLRTQPQTLMVEKECREVRACLNFFYNYFSPGRDVRRI